MLHGFLADAHGNALGLERCLAVLESFEVERIHFLGDAVGYLPDGRAVVETIRSRAATYVMGNHEAMLTGIIPTPPDSEPVIQLGRERITMGPEELAFLANLGESATIESASGPALLVHGTPSEPLMGRWDEGFTPTPEDLSHNYVFVGQTHRPFVRTYGRCVVTNVGSAGLPRDDGRFLSCAIWDSDSPSDPEILRVRVSPDAVTARYGDGIHQSVRDLFRRRAETLIGRHIDEMAP